jgi:putative transposase
MRTGKPEHLTGFSYVGNHQYSLTFCTKDRKRLFIDSDAVELVLAQISRAAIEHGFAVLAYCFMPDHVHLLVEGRTEHSDCKQFIARAKQYSGFYYSKRFDKPLWQRYSFEHVVRDSEKATTIARYILQNPMRAGLVTNIADYPFVGSLVWSTPELLEWMMTDGFVEGESV